MRISVKFPLSLTISKLASLTSQLHWFAMGPPKKRKEKASFHLVTISFAKKLEVNNPSKLLSLEKGNKFLPTVKCTYCSSTKH